MTRSRVSPDGKIAQRDVGAKLVIIMVGLPARGKSYITRKIQRYLSWQQYEAKVFNVGNRRRVVAGSISGLEQQLGSSWSPRRSETFDAPTQAAHILLNGVDPTAHEAVADEEQDSPDVGTQPRSESMDQSAVFFDPSNTVASQIREKVAMETLEELLDFLLDQGGSVGILDATNSTITRRQKLFSTIKDREPKLGILFIESVCEDEKVGCLISMLESDS
jgi:6-phosphofructo-2-kinase